MELDILKGKKVAELREIAAALKIEGAAKMKKSELIAVFTRMHEEAVASGAVAEDPKETAEEAPAKKPAKRGRKPKAAKAAEAEEPKTEAAEDQPEPDVPAGEPEAKEPAPEHIIRGV